MCRLSTVAPTKAHKAGFHPTAVYGAAGAAAGVATALRLNSRQIVDALDAAGAVYVTQAKDVAPIVEWACEQIRRRLPSEAERQWHIDPQARPQIVWTQPVVGVRVDPGAEFADSSSLDRQARRLLVAAAAVAGRRRSLM